MGVAGEVLRLLVEEQEMPRGIELENRHIGDSERVVEQAAACLHRVPLELPEARRAREQITAVAIEHDRKIEVAHPANRPGGRLDLGRIGPNARAARARSDSSIPPHGRDHVVLRKPDSHVRLSDSTVTNHIGFVVGSGEELSEPDLELTRAAGAPGPRPGEPPGRPGADG